MEINKSGGLLVGATDKNGEEGIRVISPKGDFIRMGGGEIIINEESSKKHCELLSEINQEGGGAPIPCEIKNIANTTESKMEVGDVIKMDAGGNISKYKNILEMPREERIIFIRKTLENDPKITPLRATYDLLSEKTNYLIEKYFKYDRNNPVVTKHGDKIFFEAISQTNDLESQVRYASHFVTGDAPNDTRSYDSSKAEAIDFIMSVLTDVEKIYNQPKNNRIVYTKEINIGKHCCVILDIVTNMDGGLKSFAILPNQSFGDIERKKASGRWTDALLSERYTEKSSSGATQLSTKGDLDSAESNNKDTNNNDTTKKKMNKGGEIAVYGGIYDKNGEIYGFFKVKGDDAEYISLKKGLVPVDFVTKELTPTEVDVIIKENIKNKEFVGNIPKSAIKEGTKVELEHRDTIEKIKNNPNISVEKSAELIARDHLNESPQYYKKLKEMEANLSHGGKISDEQAEMILLLKTEGPRSFNDYINESIANDLVGKGLARKNGDIYEVTNKSTTTMHNIVPMAEPQTNDTQTCKCKTMEYHEKLTACQKDKLGDKYLGEGTTVKDTKTGVVSDIKSIEHRGFKLLPQSSFDHAPRQEFFVPFEEFVEKFEAGLIDVSGYQHTDEDHKLMHFVIKDIIACNIIKEKSKQLEEIAEIAYEDVVIESTFAGGGIIGEIKANKKGEIKEIRDVNGSLLKQVHVGDTTYVRNVEDKNYRNIKNDLLMKFDSAGIHMAYGGIVGVEQTPNYYRVDISSPRKVSTCRTPKWASNVAESVKSGAKVVTCKKYKDWFISSVLVPKDGITEGGAKEIASEIKDKIQGKKMAEGGVIYETGSTSPKVNNLILFADTSRNLAETKEKTYHSIEARLHKGEKPTIEEIANRFKPLLLKSKAQYVREFGNTKEANRMASLTEKEEKEFMTLYALEFPNWLNEQEDSGVDQNVRKTVSEIFGTAFANGGRMPEIDIDRVRAIKYWGELKPKERIHFLIDHADEYLEKPLSELIGTKEFSDYKKLSSSNFNSLPSGVQGSIENHVITGTYSYGGSMATGGGVGDIHWWEVKLKMPNGKIVYEDVIADNKEDAKYYGELTDSAREGAEVLSVKSKGIEKTMENGGEIEINGYTSTNPEIEQYLKDDVDATTKGLLVLIECTPDEAEKENLRKRLSESN